MNDRFPIMRSLDPYHQRIGYLGALVMAMSRGLDMKEAIKARLEDILYERVDVHEPWVIEFVARLSPERRGLLEKLRAGREPEDNPAAILGPPDTASEWLYKSELWLHADCMPSPRGLVPPNRVGRILDLGRWTGIMTPTVEMSEAGYILQLLLHDTRDRTAASGSFNPLDPSPRPAIRLMYLRFLMGAETLWPFLVREMTQREDEGRALRTRGEDGLLRAAVDMLMNCEGEVADPSDILEMREISAFRSSLAAKASTEENYLRPRLEILVDLGLLARDEERSGRRSAFPWMATPRTRKLVDAWAQLGPDSSATAAHLDTEFFRCMASVYDVQASVVRDERVVLRWFAEAYRHVGRELGFTPGRSVAMLACLLAFEAGRILEVQQVFDVVYDAAHTAWGEHLRFSGGSRFDREFMISVAPAFREALDVSLASQPEQT